MTRDQALDDLRDSFRGILASVRRLKGRDTHRPGEPSFAQFHLLAALMEHDELPTSQLAAAADLAPATVTQMLDGLEAMGLVQRSRSTSDRRVVTCSLTDRGRALIDSLTPDHLDNERRILATLSEADQRQLADLLRKLQLGLPPQ
jgi:DNA-binding MarR family transcriptional regulator